MIDKSQVAEVAGRFLAGKGDGDFLVDVSVAPGNVISVEIDNPKGVDVDTCVALTRAIETAFDRDAEDYELEVGSVGLTTPFKVKGQYDKNIGNDVIVITRDGRKLRGVLTAATDSDFTVDITEKVKVEGKKRPEMQTRPVTIPYADAKSVVYDIKF